MVLRSPLINSQTQLACSCEVVGGDGAGGVAPQTGLQAINGNASSDGFMGIAIRQLRDASTDQYVASAARTTLSRHCTAQPSISCGADVGSHFYQCDS
eukprot:1820144-Prymnesium_polylepis.1